MEAVCAIPGCDLSTDVSGAARGWCVKHYKRWYRHGDPEGGQQPKFCSISGCDSKHNAKGYCAKHYVRWRKHGDPTVIDKGGYETTGLCEKGHPLDKTYRRKNGKLQRICSTCRRTYGNRYARKNREPRYCECGTQLDGPKKVCDDCRNGRAGHVTPTIRQTVLDRDGHQCLKCGTTTNLTIDHVWPRILGGSDQPDNLQTLCSPCNSTKGGTYADYRPNATGHQLALPLQHDNTKTLLQQLDGKYQKRHNCWIWTAATLTSGNPVLSVNGTTTTAARAIYQHYHQPPTPQQNITTTCQNKLCVAPPHLYAYERTNPPNTA